MKEQNDKRELTLEDLAQVRGGARFGGGLNTNAVKSKVECSAGKSEDTDSEEGKKNSISLSRLF
jgi:hypothetical protein